MKLNILFILSKSKLNKKGKCPIKCRVTYIKKRTPFADVKQETEKSLPLEQEN